MTIYTSDQRWLFPASFGPIDAINLYHDVTGDDTLSWLIDHASTGNCDGLVEYIVHPFWHKGLPALKDALRDSKSFLLDLGWDMVIQGPEASEYHTLHKSGTYRISFMKTEVNPLFSSRISETASVLKDQAKILRRTPPILYTRIEELDHTVSILNKMAKIMSRTK